MHSLLHELATGYALTTGCACEIETGSTHAVLSVEGLSIHIGMVESSGMLVFQTGVALLPDPGSSGQKEFYIKLLSANNLFSETMGFTIGVDTTQELVTLQLAWGVFHLNSEGFARIINNLLAVAAQWMVRLDKWQTSIHDGEQSASSAEEAFRMNSLKV